MGSVGFGAWGGQILELNFFIGLLASCSTTTSASKQSADSVCTVNTLSPMQGPRFEVQMWPPTHYTGHKPGSMGDFTAASLSQMQTGTEQQLTALSVLTGMVGNSAAQQDSFTFNAIILVVS